MFEDFYERQHHDQRCRPVNAALNNPLLPFAPFFMASCIPWSDLSPLPMTLCARDVPWEAALLPSLALRLPACPFTIPASARMPLRTGLAGCC